MIIFIKLVLGKEKKKNNSEQKKQENSLMTLRERAPSELKNRSLFIHMDDV